ncbi:EamA family transporter [Yinghuangia sp. ASG 101]|uniref:EamA family transporter n=1 Tax=Yinghuangia sp. ASG 101 TaxID=2896848 RepID=UPI001E2EFA28|nr:EamA family transporter [Yinghuangia sp. ASG 101]UGQ13109.1 EamA family transporter [Yinghuangia sp. ASG 101]
MSVRASVQPRTHGQAVLLVLVGAASIQFGAAFAAKLFPRVGPEGAVTLRLVIAAVVMLVVIRPTVRGCSRRDLLTVGGLGAALGGMNLCFYEAIARLPLGPAVTLEFLGPLGLAVVLSRRLRDGFWIVLAALGVLMLGEGGFTGLDGAGVAFVLAAALFWAAYIMLATHTARTFDGVDGLALAMAVAAVLVLPFGIAGAGAELVRPGALGAGAVVALMSSVVPYSCEMLAMKRLSAGAFGLLASLEPAVAAVAGFVVLGQSLGLMAIGGIALVVAASAGVTLGGGAETALGDHGPREGEGARAPGRSAGQVPADELTRGLPPQP